MLNALAVRAALRDKVRFAHLVVELAVGVAVVALTYGLSTHYAKMEDDGAGMRGDDLLYVALDFERGDFTSRAWHDAVVDGDRRTVLELPEVEAFAAANYVPMTFLSFERARDAEASRAGPDGPASPGARTWVLEDEGELLPTMGVTLAEGRLLAPSDSTASPPRAIVTAALARDVFGDARAVGRRLRTSNRAVPVEIIGVVESFRVAAGAAPEPRNAVVIGAGPWLSRRLQYVVRARPGGASEAITSVSRALEARSLPRVATVRALTERGVREAATGVGARYAALVMGALMLLVVFLGRVLTSSLVVAERRREIGIRRALGATKLDIVLWFMGERTLPTVVGLSLGVVLTYALAGAAEEMAPGMSLSIGPTTIAVACVTFGLYGTAGILVPALRAAAVSPREAARG